MLTAGAAGTVGVDTDVVGFDFDLIVVFDFRHNIAGSERRMTSAGAVERRYTHQTMDAFFGLQIAVSVFAVDLNGNGFQTCFVAVQHIQHFHLKACFCSPFGVHTEQHVGPVAGFCAAGTSVKGNDGVVAVVFPVQHGGYVKLFVFLQEGIVHFLDFLVDAFVFFFDAHFNEREDILVFGHKTFIMFYLVFQRFELLQGFLALLHIVPEIRIGRKFFQFGYFLFGASDVKVKPPFPLIFRHKRKGPDGSVLIRTCKNQLL